MREPSALHTKYGVYVQQVGIVTVPEELQRPPDADVPDSISQTAADGTVVPRSMKNAPAAHVQAVSCILMVSWQAKAEIPDYSVPAANVKFKHELDVSTIK